jgi:hypothetical protein
MAKQKTTSAVKVVTEHPEVSKYKDTWQLYSDAYHGEGGFADGGYLVPHPLELTTASNPTESFVKRKQLAWYLNYCAWVVDSKHSHLFKKAVVRNTGSNADLAIWINDVDRKGSNIGDFLKSKQRDAQIFGHMFIFMDRPFSKELAEKEASIGYVTKGDEKDAGVVPYLFSNSPIEVIDWSLDSMGRFHWIKARETHYRYGDLDYGQSDPMLERKEIPCLRIWTRDGTKLFDVTNEGEPLLMEEHAHQLGMVPAVVLYNKEGKDKELSGTSELKNMVAVVVRLYNLLSELDEWLRAQAFSILTLPVMPEDDVSDNISVGTGRALQYNGSSSHAPGFISAEAAHASAYEARILSLMEEIHRLANQKFKGGVVQSGSAWAFDWEEVNNALRAQAQKAEEAEYQIIRMYDRWQNLDNYGKVGEEYRVNYPETYSYSDEETEMSIYQDFILSLKDTAPSPKFVREYIKERVTKLMPNLPKEVIEEIWTEIDAWDPEEIAERANPTESNLDRQYSASIQSERKRTQDSKQKQPSKQGNLDNSGNKIT